MSVGRTWYCECLTSCHALWFMNKSPQAASTCASHEQSTDTTAGSTRPLKPPHHAQLSATTQLCQNLAFTHCSVSLTSHLVRTTVYHHPMLACSCFVCFCRPCELGRLACLGNSLPPRMCRRAESREWKQRDWTFVFAQILSDKILSLKMTYYLVFCLFYEWCNYKAIN